MEEQIGTGIGLGLFGDILLGIVGGWLFQAVGLSIGGGIIGAFAPVRAARCSCCWPSRPSSRPEPCGYLRYRAQLCCWLPLWVLRVRRWPAVSQRRDR